MMMKDLAGRIKASEKQIADLQTVWQESTKALILNELKKIKDELELDLGIETNDSIVNHESIYMTLGRRPSGLFYKTDNLFNKQEKLGGHLVKDGATLFYSIGYRGEVTVWMQLPSIDNVLWKENDYNEMRFGK